MTHLDTKKRSMRVLLAGIPWLALCVSIGAVLINVLRLNHGKFVYTLDDAYIHLALAQGIASGTYGINPGQVAAPSSSFLWPFLLVPFARMPFFEYVPFALNLIFAGLAVKVYFDFAMDALDGLAEETRTAAAAIIATLLIFVTNLVGLVYISMEHTLQVLLCAVILLGLTRLLHAEGKAQPPLWFIAALIVAPWVRYECLTVSLAALGVLAVYPGLALRRRFAICAGVLAGIALPLAGFSLFLHAHQLGWLPTSVVAKLSSIEKPRDPGLAAHLLNQLQTNISMVQGLMLAVMLLVALALLLRRVSRMDRWVNAALCAMLLAHLLVGQVGWANRYEVYMVASATLLLLYLLRQPLQSFLRRAPALALLALIGLAYLIGGPYFLNQVYTPWMVVNIYEQQYQMHRFVVDYLKAPAAVNDLGWVAFDNPQPVLDLWGLASTDALEARRQQPQGGDWMETLAAREQVKAILIYDSWFPRRPAQWQPLAYLYLGHRLTVVAGNPVTIYVRDPADRPAVEAALDAFAPTLPEGVRLERTYR